MNSIFRKGIPRLPLDGSLDLTYRCNNNCRHCWLWLPENAHQKVDELTFDEICTIVDEARQMGCQAWGISGGEPMLRPDFPEIFDYLTRKAVHYSLNTNGTLITPQIAHLLKRRGRKMVALYGATAEVHDYITRTPGSFEATMRGFSYLKEAGAGFEIQIVPMRSNYHQYKDMLSLAESLSPHYRIGASWLILSACHSKIRNKEIIRQRLEPADVLSLDNPHPSPHFFHLDDEKPKKIKAITDISDIDDRILAGCIADSRGFHIDPYGQMSFCCFIKDPALRFNLRQGSFQQAWDKFIPSLAETIRGGQEYIENCGSCELRQDCHWCGVYGYLEHGRISAKVGYLCQVAKKKNELKKDWGKKHLRYYKIAGITINVTADFPLNDNVFHSKFENFRVNAPGSDLINIKLISGIPRKIDLKLGKQVYQKPPWEIYQQPGSWVYLGLSPDDSEKEFHSVAIINNDHSRGTYFRPEEIIENGNLHSLTMFPSDQIILARVLADRQACYLHASGIILDGYGFLFVGHSEAGKSTILKLLRYHGEILCDDRIILRRWPEGIKIHGTWSHGELPDVSPAGAPLKAIFYLEKTDTNQLFPITQKRERIGKFLSHVVKPLITADWWEKTIDLAGTVAVEIPAYRLRFNKSGEVVKILKQL